MRGSFLLPEKMGRFTWKPAKRKSETPMGLRKVCISATNRPRSGIRFARASRSCACAPEMAALDPATSGRSRSARSGSVASTPGRVVVPGGAAGSRSSSALSRAQEERRWSTAVSRSERSWTSAPCARSSSTCSAFPVDTRASAARSTMFRIASSSSEISCVRSARKRSKYAAATCVSTSRCLWPRSASAIAASALAMSVRAPRFPPSGMFWLSCTMMGTVEKSTGPFQSCTISIGSSSAPAGETELCAARARAVAAWRSGFLSLASRSRSARRRGAGAASASDSSTASIACLPLQRSGVGGRMRTTRARTCPVRRFTQGSDQQGSMAEERRWSDRWRGREPHRGRCHGEYVGGQHGCGVDSNGRSDLLDLLLNEAHSIQRAERPLLAALLAAELRVLRDARFGAPDDLFARVLAEEPRARYRRSSDDRKQGEYGCATPQHGATITDPPLDCHHRVEAHVGVPRKHSGKIVLTLDHSPDPTLAHPGDRANMKIGQVATRAGVNIDTLRYYERRGLLAEPERRPSGYRDYPEETVPIIRFIKRAQDLGFTLNEIEELISLRDGGNGRRKGEIRALAEAKMHDIDQKLARLQAMRGALSSLVESCACSRGQPTCPILEALNETADGPETTLQRRCNGKR